MDSLAQVQGSPGFAVGFRFTPEELTRVRAIITKRWLNRIGTVSMELASKFEAVGIDRYHELSDLLDHAGLWRKDPRILFREDVEEIRGMSLFDGLKRGLGPLDIEEFESRGYPEVFWRLVRPSRQDDVAGVHADSWFNSYTLGIPEEQQTKLVKIWAAVFVTSGENGLQVVPNSHQREWPHHAEQRHGRDKPKLDVDEATLDLQPVKLQPGEAVAFNLWLLHGGIRHKCEQTRVNLEFAVRLK